MLYFVDIVLKLEWPINVRRYYGSSKVRGEGNSVIFINREILPRPQDASICVTFFNEIQKSILMIMIICEILLLILICFNFGN